MPSFSGHFGIMASHVPTIAVLKPGVVTVHEQDGTTKRYFGKLCFLLFDKLWVLCFQLHVDKFVCQMVRITVTGVLTIGYKRLNKHTVYSLPSFKCSLLLSPTLASLCR